MELSALPGSGPISGRLEGRTEGVRDGKVSVRLSTGSVVEIPTSEAWQPGTPVTLATGSDGKIQIIPLQIGSALAQARQSLWEALSEVLDNPQTAKEVAQALAKNDFSKAAPLLTPDSSGKPSALLSQPANVAPPATPSVVDLLSQIEPGKFQAQVAGSSWELWSSPELSTPQRLSAKASVLPDGSALWTPVRTSTAATSAPALPDTVKVDSEGARLLLDHAGFQQTPPEVVEDLAHYLRQTAERLLDGQKSHLETPLRANQSLSRSPSDAPAASAPIPRPESPIVSDPTAGTTRTPVEPDAPASTANKAAAVPRLDAQTAQRALAAWSLEIDTEHPQLSTLLGKGRSLPELLEALQTHLSGKGEHHAELSASVARILGTGKLASQERAELEERILQALSAAKDAPSEDSPLAQTARSLLGERLGESGRETVWRGETMWTKNETGWQPDRVVVHDRRKRGAQQRPDHHVAEIRLEPKGAGPIDAKLTMDGRILTVRMEAQSAETARTLRDHLGELREALDKTGLTVSGLEVARSSNPQAETSRRTGAGGGLDVRA
ncbi:MAG: flagellar hook-length control protein FliK [Fibrobacterota bacterium]|nr:flagellar hook-length control protein FliK [Fibrobacterota bacterium]QQS07444.1 MAG: flagellar hook-length control protein FliK [Fibrobacterota bacterium]